MSDAIELLRDRLAVLGIEHATKMQARRDEAAERGMRLLEGPLRTVIEASAAGTVLRIEQPLSEEPL